MLVGLVVVTISSGHRMSEDGGGWRSGELGSGCEGELRRRWRL